MLTSGVEQFTTDDLHALSEQVAAVWLAAAALDWSVPAGTLDWSCWKTADHAVDCVYAPAFFLASRRRDAYPEVGVDLTLGADATVEQLVESLGIATRFLSGVINDAAPDVRAIIFRRPEAIVAAPPDFAPRGALELILHAHDVCSGLGIAFQPHPDLCHRLREHTRPWPMWRGGWATLGQGDDAWGDLLTASGRVNQR